MPGEMDTIPLPRLRERLRRPRIVALVPAHNEEDGIGPAIESLLAQTRPISSIVVIPNGCSDRTAEIARSYPVTVHELPRQPHKKSGALNKAWHLFAEDADLVVCIDGDTVLPPFAVEHWEAEFAADPVIGGSSSQPVMTGNSILSRIQRAEFTESATLSLRRGWCRVISGTGCAFRGEALRQAARIPGQDGPWTYLSVVEDYHLTFQLRRMGWLCLMSPTVYCLTGSMKTVKALWHQRIKWQSGTIGDLICFGFGRLNWREWVQQAFALICVIFWLLWLTLNGAELARGTLRPSWSWVVFPVLFSAVESAHAWRIRGRDWIDMLLAATLVKALAYTWLSMGWILASWWVILRGSTRDLWSAQYKAEGMRTEAGERDTETQAAGHQRGPGSLDADRAGHRGLVGVAAAFPAGGQYDDSGRRDTSPDGWPAVPRPRGRYNGGHPGAGVSRDEQWLQAGGCHLQGARPGDGQHYPVHRRDSVAGPYRAPFGDADPV